MVSSRCYELAATTKWTLWTRFFHRFPSLVRSRVLVHRRVQDPEAGHDLVPVQVGALQVSEHPGFADVAQSAVQNAPVVEDHHIACDKK